MERDERLEFMSDQVRKGIPLGFLETIEVIDYQSKLKDEREAKQENSFLSKLKRKFWRTP